MLKQILLTALCATVALLTPLSTARAAADTATSNSPLAPFVNDDTFAVGCLRLGALNSAGALDGLLQQLSKLPGQTSTDSATIQTIAGVIKSLQSAGVVDAYVVLGLADLHKNGGPLLVLTAKTDQDRAAVASVLEGLAKQIAANPAMPKLAIRPHGPTTLLVGFEPVVARYESVKPIDRANLIKPLERLNADGAAASVVVAPGADFRRVIRELWPARSDSAVPLSGELINRWLSLEIAVDAPPQLKPRMALEARDAEAAQAFAKLWENLPAVVADFGENKRAIAQMKGFAELVVGLFPAKIAEKRVDIALTSDRAQVEKLTALLSKATEAALESSRQAARMQNFKEVALGILNYESARKHLPGPAILNKDGRPLLSWRVAILPYLDDQNLYLYRQFHLDEPWDSPHNLKLLKKMPSVYGDHAYPALAREGKTTVVAPIGSKTVFDTKDGTRFPEISDGTAYTILVVEAPAEKAVPWTKPADWEVDMAHPKRGLERTDRDRFIAAYCDGSVSVIPANADEKTLRENLTRDGGEVTKRP